MENQRLKSRKAIKQKRQQEKPRRYIIWASIAFLLVYWLVSGINEKKSKAYLKDTVICAGQITQTSVDGNYYLKNTPDAGIRLLDDNSYVAVQADFYLKHFSGDRIGIVLGQYETFQRNLFSKGWHSVSTQWVIENVYDTPEIAREANQSKRFDALATVSDKRSVQGKNLLMLKLKESEFPYAVDDAVFARYNTHDSILCNFESQGELTRLVGLAGS